MSEDRTQAPSKLRRQQAREQGQAAQSAELTGAAVLLAATALLGFCGEPIAQGMLTLIRDAWTGDPDLTISPDQFVEQVRTAAFEVVFPSFGLLLGSVLAALIAHQAQVQGLWAPALIAPNPARLWVGQSAGLTSRLGRGIWMLIKASIVIVLAVWAIYSRLGALTSLSTLETPALAQAWVSTLRQTTGMLALAMFLLGLVDFMLQYQRFEALLRVTAAESREDQKATDGDPALRARRVRIAKSWRGDTPELLAGATLAVVGPGGLIALLSGGPPPKRMHVRSSAKGSTGTHMRKAAEQAKIPIVENPSLARRLALIRVPSLPPELMLEVKAIFPSM